MRLMKSCKKFNRSNALRISQFNLITDWTSVFFAAGSLDEIEFYLPFFALINGTIRYSVDSHDDHSELYYFCPIRETGVVIFDGLDISTASIRMNKWNHSRTIFNITGWHLVVWIIVNDVEGILSGSVKPLLLNLISGIFVTCSRRRRTEVKKVDGNMGKMSITLTVFGRKVRELCVSG